MRNGTPSRSAYSGHSPSDSRPSRSSCSSPCHSSADGLSMPAAAYDAPSHAEPARRLAVQAAAGVAAIPETGTDLVLVRGQVSSAAADLVRAAELVAGEPEAPDERPTEELLVHPAVAWR